MIRALVAACVLAAAPAMAQSQEGNRGPAGAGLESGDANGMAGGRTDIGPNGRTGIVGVAGDHHERERAKANAKNRGRVTQPAAKAVGSGGPAGKATKSGKNYGRKPSPHAGGVATGAEAPAGAAPEGSAGKEDKK